MTTIDRNITSTLQSGLESLKSGPSKATDLGSAGLRKVGFDETKELYDGIRDQLEISKEAKDKMNLGELLDALGSQQARKLSETLKASQERSAESAKIKALADQVYAEAHAALATYQEPTAYATIKDKNGNVVGQVGQGGGVSFNSDWLQKNGGDGLVKLLSDAWKSSDDGQVVKKKQYEILKQALGDRATVELSGVDVVPPEFGGQRFKDLFTQLTSALDR